MSDNNEEDEDSEDYASKMSKIWKSLTDLDVDFEFEATTGIEKVDLNDGSQLRRDPVCGWNIYRKNSLHSVRTFASMQSFSSIKAEGQACR